MTIRARWFSERWLVVGGWWLVIALAGLVPPERAAAQESRAPIGTLVVAHGGDSAWNARVIGLVKTVNTGGPVELTFLMGPGVKSLPFQDAIKRLEEQGAGRIVVVPLLVSSHSGHYDQVRFLAGEMDSLSPMMQHHLHQAGIHRPVSSVPIQVTSALDDAPQLAQVLADRATAALPAPAGRALFLVAHGPNTAEDHAAWMENLRRVATLVKERTGFADVRTDVVRDDAPAPVRAEAVRQIREVIELQAKATGQDVLVVPVLISTGAISRSKLPQDLAGLPIRYAAEPLLPHPAIARWIESQVAVSRRSSER